MTYTVTRLIAIDAGHRIMTHGSKCRHLHGHRYTIAATCQTRGRLHDQGEQTGMVLDFAFLKEEMLGQIDQPCDHGFIAALMDEELLAMLAPPEPSLEAWLTSLSAGVATAGFCATTDCRLGTKIYVVPFQPTAECLARHWFERLAPRVVLRSDGLAELVELKVEETPNNIATYRP
ncbi:MAG: 6-carboxytetrahydropterin synthase [Alphaproteobacteria bacterium]|nr:6-carboxytetrahydropterin synthase [Alphaproteobacteria bacterium]